MVTSNEILERIRDTSRPAGVKTAMLQRRVSRDAFGRRGDFARDMAEVHQPSKGPGYVHPAESSVAQRSLNATRLEVSQAQRGVEKPTPQELSAADLVWLQRLPLNPAEIKHDDASRLAGLAAASDAMTPSSRALVESIWQPIKYAHDLREAKHQYERASKPAPTIPRSALGALIDALALEHPDWPEAAVKAHAAALLRDAVADRDAEVANNRAKARAKVEELEAAATDRAALTRSGAA